MRRAARRTVTATVRDATNRGATKMFESVPPALRIKRNWCVHRTDGERAKVPHAPAGYKLQWSIPANWITFEEAKNAYIKGLELPEGHKCRFDGLGFFVSREKDAKLDIYAVDLDDCVKDGQVDAWAKDVLSRLNSYSEISPSGAGVHVFVKGMLPAGAKNTNDQMKDKNRIEVFTDKHHITITGNRITDYPETIEDRSEIIESIYNEVMEVKTAKKEAAKKEKKSKKRVIYDAREEYKKKYVAAAIEDEIKILRSTPEGGRNNQLNRSAFAIGQFVGGHYIGEHEAIRELERAARSAGMTEKDGIAATIRSGLDDGKLNPREIPDPEEVHQSALPQILVTKEEKPKAKADKEDKESDATKLVRLAILNSFELWHTPDSDAYITLPVNSHKEHFKLSSKAVRTWLGKLGRDLMDGIPSISAIKDAVNALEGIAVYEGKEYRLYVRKAEIGGKIYVDLGDESWRAVEISEDGWKVIDDCPVRFKRSKNSLPLPIPIKGGEIDDLRPLINATTEENWILVLAWLSQAFWCRGPFAHLYLRGTQGTAKSFMMMVLKAISDPSAAIKRRLPKSERDASIALGSEAIPCFDNMSGVNDQMADLLCVASTGGVSTQRALFTDDEEAVIPIKCPIIANGIEDLGQRGDLLDRTIVLDLEPIPEESRRTEEEILEEIEEKKASLFGSLLDLTVVGLRNVESVEIKNPPRMADFAIWACACLGDSASEFLKTYTQSRENTSLDLADLNRLPAAIYSFVNSKEDKKWMGSASLLLSELNQYSHVYPGNEPTDWPRTPDKMGSELRRYTPALRAKQITVSYKRSGKARNIILEASPSVTKESQDKSIGDDTMTLYDTTLEKDSIKRSVHRDIEKESNKDILYHEQNDSVIASQCPPITKAVSRQNDTPSLGKIEMKTPVSDETRIRTACKMEFGINGSVDERKVAGKLKLPVEAVHAWLEANYKKTDNGKYRQ